MCLGCKIVLGIFLALFIALFIAIIIRIAIGSPDTKSELKD